LALFYFKVTEVALKRLSAVAFAADVGSLLFEHLTVIDVFVAHVVLQGVAFAAVSALPGDLVATSGFLLTWKTR
jgi:hypothetical protein